MNAAEFAQENPLPMGLRELVGLDRADAVQWAELSGFENIVVDHPDIDEPPPTDNLDGLRITLTLDDQDRIRVAVIG